MARSTGRCVARAGVLSLGLALAGCGANGSTGELGQGRFSYVCTGVSDRTCDGNDFTLNGRPNPGALAVGSTFSFEYFPNGTNPSATVVAASPLMISGTASSFKFEKAGEAALLARADDGHVADLIHVDGVKADGIVLSQASISLGFIAETRSISASPVSGTTTLAGALPCTWTASNAAVILVQGSPNDNDITVQATGFGSATLHVALGELTREVPVKVGP